MESRMKRNAGVLELMRIPAGPMGLSRFFAAFSQGILDKYAIWEKYPWSDAVIRYLENEKQEETSDKEEPSPFFVTVQLLEVYLDNERKAGKADEEAQDMDREGLTVRIETQLQKLKSGYDRYFGILERLYREGAQMPTEEFSRIWGIVEREVLRKYPEASSGSDKSVIEVKSSGIMPHALGMPGIRMHHMIKGHTRIPDSKTLFRNSVQRQQREFYTELVRNHVVRETARQAEYHLGRELYPSEYQALKDYGDGLGQTELVFYVQEADAGLYRETARLVLGQVGDSVILSRRVTQYGSAREETGQGDGDSSQKEIGRILTELPVWVSERAVRELYRENVISHSEEKSGNLPQLSEIWNRASKEEGESKNPQLSEIWSRVSEEYDTIGSPQLSEIWNMASYEEKKVLLQRIPQAVRQAASIGEETGQGDGDSHYEKILKTIVERIEAFQSAERTQITAIESVGGSRVVETVREIVEPGAAEAVQGVAEPWVAEAVQGVAEPRIAEAVQGVAEPRIAEAVHGVVESRTAEEISEKIGRILSELPVWVSERAVRELYSENTGSYGTKAVELEGVSPKIVVSEAMSPKTVELEGVSPKIVDPEAMSPKIVDSEDVSPKVVDSETGIAVLREYGEELVYRMENRDADHDDVTRSEWKGENLPQLSETLSRISGEHGTSGSPHLSEIWNLASYDERKVLLQRIPQAVRQAASLWVETDRGNGGPRQEEILKTIVERLETVQSAGIIAIQNAERDYVSRTFQSVEGDYSSRISKRAEGDYVFRTSQSTEGSQSPNVFQRIEIVQSPVEGRVSGVLPSQEELWMYESEALRQRIPDVIGRILSELPIWVSERAADTIFQEDGKSENSQQLSEIWNRVSQKGEESGSLPQLSEIWNHASKKEMKILLQRIPQAVRQAASLWVEGGQGSNGQGNSGQGNSGPRQVEILKTIVERLEAVQSLETIQKIETFKKLSGQRMQKEIDEERTRRLRIEEAAAERMRRLRTEEIAAERMRKLRTEETASDGPLNRVSKESSALEMFTRIVSRIRETHSETSYRTASEMRLDGITHHIGPKIQPDGITYYAGSEIQLDGITHHIGSEIRMDSIIYHAGSEIQLDGSALQYEERGENAIVYAIKEPDSPDARQSDEDMQVIHELESRISRQEYIIRQEQLEREELMKKMKKQEDRGKTVWKSGNMEITSKSGAILSQNVLSQLQEQFRLERIRYGAD